MTEAGPATRTRPERGTGSGGASAPSSSAKSNRVTRADLWRVGCLVALAFLGGIEWHRVFGWGPVVGRVAVAAVLPGAVAVFFRLRRPAGAGIGIVVSLVLGVWYVAVVALHDTVAAVIPSASAPSGIVDGVVNGWAAILSVPLPVPAQGEYLVLPVVLTWLAVLAGAELVLRSPWPLAGAVPPVLAYGLTLLFGIGGLGSRLVTSGAFLGVALLLAGATARPVVVEQVGDAGARRRRGAEIAGCLAVVVVVAALLGPALPLVGSGPPYNPRTTRVPPVTPASAIDPLDQLSVWALDPHGSPLLTVRWTGPARSLRLAVLDHYSTVNGWTDSSRFTLAGTELPSGTVRGRTTTVRQDVRIDSLPGPWLPAAVRPVQITGTRAVVDPSTGVLAAIGSTRGLRYQVTSEVPTQDCRLDQAVPFSPGEVPSLPPLISSLATQYAGGATSPCQRATELAAAFSQRFSYNPKAPSGSDIQVLLNFLQGPKSQDGGTGTYEQAAAACALMAEALGMKARVVVGFHAGHSLGHGTYRIRPDDAYAWVEVDFVGAGWVPFYPTLRNGPTPPADKTDQGSSQLHHTNVTAPTGGTPVERATPSQLHQQQGSSWVVAGVVLGIVVGTLMLLVALSALAVWSVRRRRRQRRRSAADPRRRVLGAWEESLDVLATVGVRHRASQTAAEVASSGTDRLGAEAETSLASIGRLSNAARYSDRPPGSGDADTAWSCADSLAAVSGRALSRWGRLRRALDLRVLFRRHAAP
ncbi:MAG: transglutaminase TgpA family protein [Acidimicrobiales bacterium]